MKEREISANQLFDILIEYKNQAFQPSFSHDSMKSSKTISVFDYVMSRLSNIDKQPTNGELARENEKETKEEEKEEDEKDEEEEKEEEEEDEEEEEGSSHLKKRKLSD